MASTSAHDAPLPYGLEEEIDLVEYLVAVFRAKYLIILLAITFAGAGYGLALRMPERYQSYVHLALREPTSPGGVAPDDRRAPAVLTLMEHGFVMDAVSENYRFIITARMRSRMFTQHFMREHNILPHLYPEMWDEDKKAWIDGFTPNWEEAYKIFHENVRAVTYNPENELMAVHMRWHDRQQAADWANAYVKTFNDYMRNITIQESERKMAFLENELRQTSMVEMQRSIYRIIEAEIGVRLLANAREEYVLEVLDRAVPALRPFSPSKKRLVVFGFIGGFALAISLAIGNVLVRKIRTAMLAYRARTHPQMPPI